MKEVIAGLKCVRSQVVEYQHTAAALGNGSVEVFSTPHMLALVEMACADAVAPYLDEGEVTVGMKVELTHLAPTPVGMKVSASAVLEDVKGKLFTFKVDVNDEEKKAGIAVHTRAVVKLANFLGKHQ